jgi:hypothetical protein
VAGFRVFLSSTLYDDRKTGIRIMEKTQQVAAQKRPQRISPELAEVLKMLSALESRDVAAPAPKAA